MRYNVWCIRLFKTCFKIKTRRTTTSISLDDSWCKESILTGNKKKSENMKTAPGRSFTIRNPGKKCFLQNLAQCLSWWSTFYWMYHCLEVYSYCIFSLSLQQRNAPERFYVGSWQKKREVGCSKILSSESTGTAEINCELKYRKIPKISPSMYKPLQI